MSQLDGFKLKLPGYNNDWRGTLISFFFFFFLNQAPQSACRNPKATLLIEDEMGFWKTVANPPTWIISPRASQGPKLHHGAGCVCVSLPLGTPLRPAMPRHPGKADYLNYPGSQVILGTYHHLSDLFFICLDLEIQLA